MVQPLPQRADLILPYGGKIVIAQQTTGLHTVVLIAIHTSTSTITYFIAQPSLVSGPLTIQQS